MRQYSFYNVDLVINGEVVDGFHDSSQIITVSRARESFGKIVGARGEVVVNTIADRTGMFTFNILQTSDWNKILRDLLNESQNQGLSGNIATFTPIQIQLSDKMGRDQVTGINGWISGHPTFVRGTEVNMITWTIEVERVDFIEGDDPEIGV